MVTRQAAARLKHGSPPSKLPFWQLAFCPIKAVLAIRMGTCRCARPQEFVNGVATIIHGLKKRTAVSMESPAYEH